MSELVTIIRPFLIIWVAVLGLLLSFPRSGEANPFTFTNIADSSGPFSFGGGFLSINAGGTVAFFAGLDAGGSGIFIGPDPVADKVIAIGDPLFGSTVTSLGFFRGLDDNLQVAFFATLAVW